MAVNFFGPVKTTLVAVAGGTSLTTSGLTTTAGNLLVVCITLFSGNIGAAPITDNKSNTWVQAVAKTGTSSGFAAMFYAQNCLGGAGHTFTLTTTSSDFSAMVVYEIEGAALTSSLSNTNAAVSATSAHSSGSVSANASVAEIFIGCGSVSSGVSPIMTSVDPGFWWVVGTQTGSVTEGIISAFRLVDPSVSDSFNFTAGARNESSIVAGFKKAASGGGGGGGGSFTFFGA